MEIPESHLSPKVKGAILPDDLLNPTVTATTANQDVDESDETNVAQPLETGPLVLQLSYSVGYCTLRISILGTHGRCSAVRRFTLEDSE